LEAAGEFEDAAKANDTYVGKYPDQPGARDRLVRALCMWRQLDNRDRAWKDLQALERSYPKVKVDRARVCDGVRPIRPPPAK
jgi:TolA-binding protein